jgi:outer membrane protein OmpA-like peptidoglycan-associated protein
MKNCCGATLGRLTATCLFAWLSSPAAGATDVKGMIMSRSGETFVVKSGSANTTVVLTADTKTNDNTGLFGLRENEMAAVVLIPGLKVNVEGAADDNGRVIAKTITLDGDDLEASQMIQAGLHPTAEQVAANTRTIEALHRRLQALETTPEPNSADRVVIPKPDVTEIQTVTDRFLMLGDYDIKSSAIVKFEAGESGISSDDQEQLKQVATTASGLPAYLIEVTGYADSTGAAMQNEKLSADRAKSVVSYLMQQCNIPVRHIIAPGAMGEFQPAATNETAEGRAENRRVEIKVLVNKEPGK